MRFFVCILNVFSLPGLILCSCTLIRALIPLFLSLIIFSSFSCLRCRGWSKAELMSGLETEEAAVHYRSLRDTEDWMLPAFCLQRYATESGQQNMVPFVALLYIAHHPHYVDIVKVARS